MDLFASAGIDLPRSGASGPRSPAPRSLRVPLFAYKVVQEARSKVAFAPSPEQRAKAADYARKAKRAFGRQSEVAVRTTLISDVLVALLGYKAIDPESVYSLAVERQIGRGSVDVALGQFDDALGRNEIVAPFELKGPKTADLDAPMPGRGRSPVQQAWDYAIDAPGAHWVLVSNCLEIRLYGFGRGRDAYEVFDLGRLDEEEEYARLWLMLSAERLLGGGLDELLRQTDSAYMDITSELYTQYKGLRSRLIDFFVNSAEGPKLTALQAIEPGQKILDRILFIAFAQRTDLLPDRMLERAAKVRNEFVPAPLWSNFTALFRAVDQGNTRLNVWRYNGGLFAADPVVDALALPDDLAGEVADLGKWDYRSEVPVTLLGHIFEQSITDIERLKAEHRGEAPPKVSQRKREGVVYTPDMVTRFLVEKTVGVTLREFFDAAWTRLGMGENASEEQQRTFWRAYVVRLRSLTIVDPACGSGAFLVAAFDALASEYRRADKALEALNAPIDFDIFDEIVSNNLYGVDLNPESVEITRLSLWLKTARRDHRLQDLEATIQLGDSLIEDGAFTPRPFDWHAAFPRAFQNGGFDIVIGNPPYVRAETIKDKKEYLQRKYAVFDSGADLYCYFYERSPRKIGASNARIGLISSCGFLKATFGERLRNFLAQNATFECGIDFGDTPVFEGVTTYPNIFVFRNSATLGNYNFSFANLKTLQSTNLSKEFEINNFDYPSNRLFRRSWHFEDASAWGLRDKLEGACPITISSVGEPFSGIKTGRTSVFVISEDKMDALSNADLRCRELFRSWITGDDVGRWEVEGATRYIIFLPKGWTKEKYGEGTEDELWLRFQHDYGPVANWLAQSKAALESRSDKGDYWWELRACDYYDKFESEEELAK